MDIGDTVQIIYKREKSWTFEVVQGLLEDMEPDWLTINGTRYRTSKIKSLRNLTKEALPPRIEDE